MENTQIDDSIETHTSIEDENTVGTRVTLIAGLLAGLTASACCAGPFILLLLGISGSWISNLSALEAYRPFFMIAAVAFLGFAYYKIFIKARACNTDAVCATPQGIRSQRLIFWVTLLVVAASIAFPWYGPLLLD